MEQLEERRTVQENLQDGIGKAHVAGVDESARLELGRRWGRGSTAIGQ